jgi:hypothetical protein
MRSLAVLIACVGLLFAGVIGARSLVYFLTSASTQGTVVEHVSIDSQHYFVVRYQVGGETHEVRSHRYPGRHSGNTGMHVSQIVTVLYPPDAPRDGRIYTFTEQLGVPLGVGAPSLGLLLYGLSKPGGAARTEGKSKKRRSRSRNGKSR